LSRELQESNVRLEEAQSVAHVGQWKWDLETGTVVWSDETYRIFGSRPQERPMDIAAVRAIVHPDDRDSLYGGVDEDLVLGVNPVAEFRIVPSGEVRIRSRKIVRTGMDDHFVIIEAVGPDPENMQDVQPLEKKRSVSLEELFELATFR
jgi:hypothetical protein